MRWSSTLGVWWCMSWLGWAVLSSSAYAQAPAPRAAPAGLPPATSPAAPAAAAPEEPPAPSAPPPAAAPSAPRGYREPGAYFAWQPPPAVGSCIGGDCGAAQPRDAPEPRPPELDPRLRRTERRMRFAYTGAVLGAVSAGLVLGGAIAIAAIDDAGSEKVTRGIWLGTVAVGPPIIALSAHLARKASSFASPTSKSVRRLGWLAYGLAVSDGALLWASAFSGLPRTDLLTVGAGAFAVVALLPHALDAFTAGRAIRLRRFLRRVDASATGLELRF